MRRIAWRALLAAASVALVTAGCVDGNGPDRDGNDSGMPDDPGIGELDGAIDGIEDGVPARDANANPGDVVRDTLVSEPYVPSPSIRFRAAGRDGEAWLVEVVARDLPDIFGMALRVEFDPTRLAYEGATFDPVFGNDEVGIYRAGEVHPGSVSLASSYRSYFGDTPLEGDVVVATLALRALGDDPVALSFYAPRSMALTRRLESVAVTYLPATLFP